MGVCSMHSLHDGAVSFYRQDLCLIGVVRCQCHFDPSVISQADVLAVLLNAERSLPDSASDLRFPGRKITFPIILDDQWCRDALQRYMRTTRNSAVYLPSNVDYLARNNGLEGGVDEALQKLMDSAWVRAHNRINVSQRLNQTKARFWRRILSSLSFLSPSKATLSME
jgi:hypothetical protein